MKLTRFIIIVVVISSVYLSCTDNPFFKDSEFLSDKLIIKGMVELDQSDDPSGVYVWLEGLNVSTYTKSNGTFELHLASPASLPGGATAWNGEYRLYYYLANYHFDWSSILIRNGKVEYGKRDLDDSGTINKTILLKELIGIKTSIDPSTIQNNEIFRQKVDLFFTVHGDRVRLQTYVPITASSGCVIFRRLDAAETLSTFVLANQNNLQYIYIQENEVWHMQLGSSNELGIKDMDPIPIESGLYEVVPFLLIQQEDLPAELIESLTPYYYTLSAEYLKIPFKWQVDTFEVK